MLRRIASAAVAGAALLAAFGCGGGGGDASIRSTRDGTVTPAASNDDSTSTTVAGGLQTVSYRGVQFEVPSGWPVHDLDADPTTCVRFDVSAVYLGHPGADMDCPAGLVGRADAVLVEPTDGHRHHGSQSGQGDSTSDVSEASSAGLGLQVAPDGASASEVAADIPTAGVSVTLTYRDSDATAQQILQSFRAAS